MSKYMKYLVGLHAFNALSATGGGIALMSGGITHAAWTAHTDFRSLYFPGVILFAFVGGSSLLALFSIKKEMVGWQLASVLAGLIMVFWIVGEIVSIRQFDWLQAIYFLTGALVLYFSYSVIVKDS